MDLLNTECQASHRDATSRSTKGAAIREDRLYQFAKVFEGETEGLDPKDQTDYLQTRIRADEDPIPHRHKQRGTPLYSIYYTSKGEEKHYAYIESRYFYCHYYERLTEASEDLATLRGWLDLGWNLEIFGYEPSDPWDDYNDPTRPFGHELVLYALLTVQDPKDYPWNRYRREHPKIYELGWL